MDGNLYIDAILLIHAVAAEYILQCFITHAVVTLTKRFQSAIATAVLKRKCRLLRFEDDRCAAPISGGRKDKRPKCLLELRNGIDHQTPGLTIFLRRQGKADVMC